MTYDEQARAAEKGADAITLAIVQLRPELSNIERDALKLAEKVLREKAKQAKLNALAAKRQASHPLYVRPNS